MNESRLVVREIAWREVFPGLLLLRCFRLAIDPRKLILAALGIWLTMIGWSAIDGWWGDAPVPAPSPAAVQPGWPALPADADDIVEQTWVVNPLLAVWEQLSLPYRGLFLREIGLATAAKAVLEVVWAALVWGLLGGAITRMAALQLSREQRCSLGRALQFARGRLLWFLAAPLLPLGGVAVAIVVGGLLPGLLMRSDAGLLLVGLFWWLLLILIGVTLAILLFGLLFGWPLLWAAISIEGTDAFDAVSRSYSYTYQRPLHYLGYTAVAALLGALGMFVVTVFATLVIHLTAWTLSWGSGAETMAAVLGQAYSHLDNAPTLVGGGVVTPVEHNTLGRAGLHLIGLTHDVVTLLVLGFSYSFFWTAATAIYLLLRLSADASEVDEVYLDEPLDEPRLPPLKTDAAGVQVLDEERA